MTVYDTERDYIRDQLSSYRKAKKELNKIIQDFLVVSHEDYRGDNEKIFSALCQSINFIDTERKQFYGKHKDRLRKKDTTT